MPQAIYAEYDVIRLDSIAKGKESEVCWDLRHTMAGKIARVLAAAGRAEAWRLLAVRSNAARAGFLLLELVKGSIEGAPEIDAIVAAWKEVAAHPVIDGDPFAAAHKSACPRNSPHDDISEKKPPRDIWCSVE